MNFDKNIWQLSGTKDIEVSTWCNKIRYLYAKQWKEFLSLYKILLEMSYRQVLEESVGEKGFSVSV